MCSHCKCDDCEPKGGCRPSFDPAIGVTRCDCCCRRPIDPDVLRGLITYYQFTRAKAPDTPAELFG